MAHKFFEERRPHNGLTYEEYKSRWIEELENENPETLDKSKKELYDYKKLNLQRSNRISKSYNVSEELKEAIASINEEQLWMVITEAWCGDSAQTLPYIAKIAGLNSKVNLRILLRDTNPDIIDLYLTNGTKSIPKLVAFDNEGSEIFTWGPRPKTAQDYIKQLKAEGIVKPELYEKLHLWYGRNRGKDLEDEFLQIFSNIETR